MAGGSNAVATYGRPPLRLVAASDWLERPYFGLTKRGGATSSRSGSGDPFRGGGDGDGVT